MKPILFSLDQTSLVEGINRQDRYEIGKVVLRQFPDEETYVKIDSDVKDRKILLLASLDRPNDKILPLLFLAETARNLGIKEVSLVVPYLAYVRQDKQFNPGEGITSQYFASLLSRYFDWLVTIDPHLHRYHSLSEIYTIPTTVLHAAEPVAQWIRQHVDNPIIIGPDKESEQWVADIAKRVNSPFITLEKIRKGDRLVTVSLPKIEQYKECIPILLDDIISTARTMIETVKHLQALGMKPPICIAVHPLFSANAYEDLLKAGVRKIISCNTIQHITNAIDVSGVIANALKEAAK